VRIAARHVFRRATIATRWTVRCRRTCAALHVRAHFPSWGDRIEALLRNGTRVRLGLHAPRAHVRLADIDRVVLGGYRITRLTGPPNAQLFAVPVAGEPTNPTPGPTLAVELTARRPFRSIRLAAALEPLG
jgi:hypothetical protein